MYVLENEMLCSIAMPPQTKPPKPQQPTSIKYVTDEVDISVTSSGQAGSAGTG